MLLLIASVPLGADCAHSQVSAQDQQSAAAPAEVDKDVPLDQAVIEEAVDAYKPLEDEITGFTLDYTITRMGHDFVQYLSRYRTANLPESTYNLTVYERPSAALGSLIWIDYNYTTLYRNFIHPNTDIQLLAEQLMPALDQAIAGMQLQDIFTENPDLARPEI